MKSHIKIFELIENMSSSEVKYEVTTQQNKKNFKIAQGKNCDRRPLM
jgi:hypothetical protein